MIKILNLIVPTIIIPLIHLQSLKQLRSLKKLIIYYKSLTFYTSHLPNLPTTLQTIRKPYTSHHSRHQLPYQPPHTQRLFESPINKIQIDPLSSGRHSYPPRWYSRLYLFHCKGNYWGSGWWCHYGYIGFVFMLNIFYYCFIIINFFYFINY